MREQARLTEFALIERKHSDREEWIVGVLDQVTAKHVVVRISPAKQRGGLGAYLLRQIKAEIESRDVGFSGLRSSCGSHAEGTIGREATREITREFDDGSGIPRSLVSNDIGLSHLVGNHLHG